MRKPPPTTRFAFKTYQQLLRVLSEGAMVVVQRVADELKPERQAVQAVMGFSVAVRNFAILTRLVRRSIVVSRYIETLPVPTEEREHRLGAAFDRVFRLFAAHKMSVADYDRAMDAEIDGELEDEFGQEYDPEADVRGRAPAALVAELCRDFGMIVHAMPPEWLKPVSTNLRLLCARAAAASIRPAGPADRTGEHQSLER